MENESMRTDPAIRDRINRLLASANALCAGDEQRRDSLVARAEAHGVSRPLAERVYDLAQEEHLPPAYGIAVAAAGISVRPLEANRVDVAETESREPDWVDAPPPADAALVERRLRQTFRRMRSHLAEDRTPAEALSAFGGEPDLEAFDY
jgi:hypothetical protein